MLLPDINVLIYAHRQDGPEHDRYASWLRRLVDSRQPFALSSWTLNGFLRLTTHSRIFDPPTPTTTAFQFCQKLIDHPRAVLLEPGRRHWSILKELAEKSQIRGGLFSDAYLAALAIEHGCEIVTNDSDFARFPGLRWSHPLGTRSE